MPTYQFFDKRTGESVGDPELLTIREMEERLSSDPNLDTRPAAPLIHSGRGMKKNSQWFRDRMKDIKKTYGKNHTTFQTD